jgi:hypothetical protein
MVKSWAVRVGGAIVLAAFMVFLGACGTTSVGGIGTTTSMGGIGMTTSGSIAGRIVSQTTGDPVTDVPVRIASTIVHTDQFGRFFVSGLRAGQYTLSVDANGYQNYTQDVRVSAGDIQLGDISLLDLPPEPPVL